MSQIPTPPATPAPSALPDSSFLNQKLDTLLERYLHLLDLHQTLSARLQSQFSHGFFSLARAQFAARSHFRYGQDYYDERMKAGRRVVIQPKSREGDEAEEKDGSDGHYAFIVKATSATMEAPTTVVNRTGKQKDSQEGGFERDQSPKKTNEEKNGAEKEEDLDLSALSIDEHKEKEKHRDPLRWFGILVPPVLRDTQKSFTIAMEETVPKLASVVAEMCSVEAEVEKVREQLKKLG